MTRLRQDEADALRRVMAFFGADLHWNKHIFEVAVANHPQEFRVVVLALDRAIQADSRFGMTERIQRRLAEERKARGVRK